MSSTVWKFEKDLCRCCHSEGSYKSMYEPYFWLDTEEVVYSKMLQECFGIELAPVRAPSNHMCGICRDCVQRLLDAELFKRQVQKCERRFRDMYLGQIDSALRVDVKEELPDPEDNDFAFANMTAGCFNGAIKNDLDSRTSDDGRTDDDGATADHQQEMDFKLEVEVIPVQTVKKSKRLRTKMSSAKVKKKKKVNRPKKTVLTENEEMEENVQGIKVVKRPKYIVQDGVDYKQVDDYFQCCRCEKTNKSIDYIKSHVKKVHLKIPKYICQICSEALLTPAAFTKHKYEEHSIDERHRCNACDSVFNTKVQLKKHINGFHMLGRKCKCDKCDYEAFSIEALYKHKFKHKTVKDYHCAYCRKSFVRKTTLQLHEKIHTGDKRKVCKECGQAFVQKASLNYHMAKYHPEVDF